MTVIIQDMFSIMLNTQRFINQLLTFIPNIPFISPFYVTQYPMWIQVCLSLKYIQFWGEGAF